jgi:hypothetical protein
MWWEDISRDRLPEGFDCVGSSAGRSLGTKEAGAMAENKTKPSLQRVGLFLDEIRDEARRVDAKALVALMEEATGEKATMWGASIVGFGRYRYRHESGREGENMLAGFSPRKAAMALYGVAGFHGAEALLSKLGKHTRGKGCLYLKRLEDADRGVLKDLIGGAVAEARARHGR